MVFLRYLLSFGFLAVALPAGGGKVNTVRLWASLE